jgi:hypothetical protein
MSKSNGGLSNQGCPPRGAAAPLGVPQEPRRRRRHGSCYPRFVAAAPRRPRKARRRALLPTPRPAGRRAWQGASRSCGTLMLGPLAAGLRFRRPRGRGRRSALLHVGPRLAARSSLVRRRPAKCGAGSFRPSSRLRSSGARASSLLFSADQNAHSSLQPRRCGQFTVAAHIVYIGMGINHNVGFPRKSLSASRMIDHDE